MQDIDSALADWEFKPGMVQAHLVEGQDGRQLVQMRVDLGLLQLEVTGRPDGTQPHGCPTYCAYLQKQASVAKRAGRKYTMTEEQCEEADREFIQFYHRRLCWLALHQFDRAVEDADHTLEFMDFVRDHAPEEDYARAHEQFRPFVLFHRTQAASAQSVEEDNPEGAIDAIRAGLESIRRFYVSCEAEEQMGEDELVQQLHKMEESLRSLHNIGQTLQEQLAEAVAKEEYETAARLRDELKRRQ